VVSIAPGRCVGRAWTATLRPGEINKRLPRGTDRTRSYESTSGAKGPSTIGARARLFGRILVIANPWQDFAAGELRLMLQSTYQGRETT